MKTIIRTIIYGMVALAAMAAASCTKNGAEAEYLQLSLDRYTFMGTGTQTIKVAVESSSEWKYECDAEWIKLEQPSEDTLSISVIENKSGEQRNTTIHITSGNMADEITVEQLSDRFKGIFEEMYYLGHNLAMSSNGKYICGMKTKEIRSDAYIYTPILINTHTGEKTELTDIQGYDQVASVSDDGKVIVYIGSSGAESKVFREDQEVEVKLPEGYKNPRVEFVNEDGSVWIGYCKSLTAIDGWKPSVSVKWTNGEPEILESPTTNIWGDKYTLDVFARGASKDISVIYGSEFTDFGIIYWKNGELFYPGYDFADKNTNTSVRLECERTNISPNGKYLGCSTAELYTGSFAVKTPAVIDTENYKLITFENSDEGACTHVTNDGLAFIACPSLSSSYGFVADVKTKEVTPISDWMQNEFGITFLNGYIRKVSDDGKVIFGIRTISTPLGDGYIPFYCYTGE